MICYYFSALQCLYAYLPNHMAWLGFTRGEIRTITLIASLVSTIGPLIVGFILDRVSVKRPASYGKWLRVLLFICFIAAGIFFGLLLLITPEYHKVVGKDPTSTFSCNDNGAHLFVRRINNDTCENLNGQGGHLKLYNCSYTCEMPENFKTLYHKDVAHQKNIPSYNEKLQEEPFSSSERPSDEDDYDENKSYNDENLLPSPEALTATQPPTIPPPHICFDNGTNVNCHVYLDGDVIHLKRVEGTEKDENESTRFSDNWCTHPLCKSYKMIF